MAIAMVKYGTTYEVRLSNFDAKITKKPAVPYFYLASTRYSVLWLQWVSEP